MSIILNLIKSRKGKIFLPFILLAFFGLVIEDVVRALSGNMVGFNGIKYISLMGYTSLWMLPVYFIGSFTLAIINDIPWFYNKKMLIQTILGGLCLIIIEFISGVILNIYFKLNVWSYENDFCNLLGQIKLSTSIVWILAVPFFIFVIDFVDYALYREEKLRYGVLENYKELVNDIKLLIIGNKR
jgi:uncharacterized membrane protein